MVKASKLLLATMFVVVVSSSAFAAVSPVAHWTMDQSDYVGGEYVDSVGGSHNATANSAPADFTYSGTTYPAYIAGANGDAAGGALMVSGAFGEVGTWNPVTSGELTVSAWVNWLGVSGGAIIMKKDMWAIDDMMWQLNITSGGKLRFRDGDSSHDVNTQNGDMPIGEWAHVCATKDATGGKVYLNGVLLQSNALFTLGTDTGSVMRFGATQGADTDPAKNDKPLDAYLDDVKVYDTALTAAEVLAEFNAVPEPATMSLLVIGGVAMLRRKRKA